MRSEQLIQKLLVLIFFGALALTLLDPFGYLVIFSALGRSDSLHNVTFLCFSFLTLFGWRVFKKAPLKIRILLSGAFCVAGYGLYDLLWFLAYFTYSPFGMRGQLLSVFLYFSMFLIIPMLGLWLGSRKYQLPRIQWGKLALVFVLNLAVILMLDLSGFFPAYIRFLNDLVFQDPHGWIWIFGKILGMCSWFLVYLGKREHSSGGTCTF